MIKHYKNTMYIIIGLIVILVILSFIYINKKVLPVMIEISSYEVKLITNKIINDSVKEELDKGLTFDKLFITTYEGSKISTIDFDSIIVNRVQNNITNNILNKLKDIDNNIVYKVPLTYSYNNTFLTNISPKIPVRIHPIGYINSKVKTKVTNYGINNALIEVYIDITVTVQVVLPLISNKVDTNLNIPIAIKLVKGEIPNYFGSNNYSIPIE